MNTLFFIVMMIYLVIIVVVGVVWFGINTLRTYPHSKLSKWIRKHIVTDQDLDPPSSEG